MTFKIAFVSTMAGFPWGGSEELWSQTAIWLASQGHTISASVRDYPQPRPQLTQLQRLGVAVKVRRYIAPSLLRRVFQRLKLLQPIDMTHRLFQNWLLQIKPDLVCLSSGAITDIEFEYFASVCLEQSIPFVTVGQANAEIFWTDSETAQRSRKIFQSAMRCFFVSQGNQHLFEKQIATSLTNAEIVCNPFQVNYDAAPPWTEPTESSPWRLACVARLDPRAKGQDLLVDVLSQQKWRDRPLQISLFGSGPMATTLKQLVSQYQLESKIKFAGHVSNVEDIWQSHHALILPSRYEGLPLALVECMLCGRPAIVTDVAGNKEVLDDGETGFIAEAPTVKHLDEAIERAWEQRHNWQAMGQLAGERIRQKVPRNPAVDFGQRLLKIVLHTKNHK
ncbi:glycosyltransferase [Picosynechococcus sp. NKBG042902]|uniref:glycosyltransferase n=1 Tax=Picosynechococcus sp. NKBG042902 TaxID=490193 RepID=UPI0004AA11D5|nr:glycosyltransferase [Picosynechococcus sp. NKBG042902]